MSTLRNHEGKNMPYADREQQLAAMRAWRRRRKLERERGRQQPHTPLAQVKTRPQVSHPIDRSAPRTPQFTPRFSPTPGAHSPRRKLLADYQRERDAGRTDVASLATSVRNYRAAQQLTQEEAQRDHDAREILRLAPQYAGVARRRLSMGGSYNESSVWPMMVQLATHALHARQTPRPPDVAQRLLVSAPQPTPPERSITSTSLREPQFAWSRRRPLMLQIQQQREREQKQRK